MRIETHQRQQHEVEEARFDARGAYGLEDAQVIRALAAIALLTGIRALLAARLTTLMIAIFGLFVWLPAPILHPQLAIAWFGNAENWAICGAAWIVADYLQRY